MRWMRRLRVAEDRAERRLLQRRRLRRLAWPLLHRRVRQVRGGDRPLVLVVRPVVLVRQRLRRAEDGRLRRRLRLRDCWARCGWWLGNARP